MWVKVVDGSIWNLEYCVSLRVQSHQIENGTFGAGRTIRHPEPTEEAFQVFAQFTGEQEPVQITQRLTKDLADQAYIKLVQKIGRHNIVLDGQSDENSY